jgi:hypothetical protein
VLQKFSSFVRRYAASQSSQSAETDQLPGTTKDLKPTTLAAGAPAAPADGTVLASIRQSTIKTAARSPFVVVSGNSDNFDSLPDLVGSLKDGIYLDRSLVPVVAEIGKVACNAYLTDFFDHGERAPLATENGLRDASLYDRLNKFCHALRVIKDALNRRCEGETKFTRIDQERTTKGAPPPKTGFGSKARKPLASRRGAPRKPASSFLVPNRCCEVQVHQEQDEWEEKSGTLARIQIKIIKGEPYHALYQCENRVATPGSRCQPCAQAALLESITSLETEYLKRFKDVFAFKAKW